VGTTLPDMDEHEARRHLPDELSLEDAAHLLRLPWFVVAYAAATGKLPRRLRRGRLVIPTASLLASFDLPVDSYERSSHVHDS